MGVLLLLEHPEQLSLLQEEPGRFPEAIREILRYRSFTKFLPRYLQEDIELHGTLMRQGQIALLLFQSAFRDPEAFDKPGNVAGERRVAVTGRSTHPRERQESPK